MSSISPILAPISLGELIDKITILEIKAENIHDSKKRVNITHELRLLEEICTHRLPDNIFLLEIRTQLKTVNQTLWDIEDRIRLKEKSAEFDDEFTQLARNVYITNDQRSALKCRINQEYGSDIIEEKSYAG